MLTVISQTKIYIYIKRLKKQTCPQAKTYANETNTRLRPYNTTTFITITSSTNNKQPLAINGKRNTKQIRRKRIILSMNEFAAASHLQNKKNKIKEQNNAKTREKETKRAREN